VREPRFLFHPEGRELRPTSPDQLSRIFLHLLARHPRTFVRFSETDRTDAPMATIEVQQVVRTGFGGSQGGDEIDDLGGGFARCGHGADELSDLRDKGPGRGKNGRLLLWIRFGLIPLSYLL
jgi:hypothetical protein